MRGERSANSREARVFERPKKPPIALHTTTLWDYPSQHYGRGMQGDQAYRGATPSHVVWNVVSRWSQPGELVVDPMCGSGTTIDVARELGREVRGFDVAPYRADIQKGDARELPLPAGRADLVFFDPPYGDHIRYSDDPRCIGKLSAYDERFYAALDRVVGEAHRVLRKGGHLAIFVCDYFEKKHGFAPVGFACFDALARRFTPVDVIAVVRHAKTLEMGNYHKAADEGGFFLRGFSYLLVGRKDR